METLRERAASGPVGVATAVAIIARAKAAAPAVAATA